MLPERFFILLSSLTVFAVIAIKSCNPALTATLAE